MSDTIANQIIALVAEAISASPDELNLESAVGVTPGWDSLGHLAIITAIESKYNIQLTVDDVTECESIGDLADAVEQYI